MQTNQKTEITKDQILDVAKKMKADGKFLIMIHGFVDKEGNNVITYDYSLGPVVDSYEVKGEKVIPSITPIYAEAAEWSEREIAELIDIKFEGLDTSKRLFMPDNLLEGNGQILVTPLEELRKKNVDERADGLK